MRIGLVGANGEVGTELSFLLRREESTEVVPIVRSQIAASTFETHDFNYRVGEITDDEQAKTLLEGLDGVIVAAYAPRVTRGTFQPKDALEINKAIVENATKYAASTADVIYFNSVAAFGQDIGESDWWWYGRVKRQTGEHFLKTCDEVGRRGYNLRLGHVYGFGQRKSNELSELLENQEVVYADTDREKASNVVHTVVIKEAILTCLGNDISLGTYTVVNQPQWTWGKVFDYYAPESTVIVFEGSNSSNKSGFKRVVKRGLSIIKPTTETLLPITLYFPRALNSWLFYNYVETDAQSELNDLTDKIRYHRREFDQRPAPGSPLPQLESAETLLEDEPLIDLFEQTTG